MYYAEEIVEEVRTRNDIVEVIGGYVRLRKRAAAIGASAPSTMRSPPLFPSTATCRCITASAAALEGMSTPS